jgi:hypothetical protein
MTKITKEAEIFPPLLFPYQEKAAQHYHYDFVMRLLSG